MSAVLRKICEPIVFGPFDGSGEYDVLCRNGVGSRRLWGLCGVRSVLGTFRRPIDSVPVKGKTRKTTTCYLPTRFRAALPFSRTAWAAMLRGRLLTTSVLIRARVCTSRYRRSRRRNTEKEITFFGPKRTRTDLPCQLFSMLSPGLGKGGPPLKLPRIHIRTLLQHQHRRVARLSRRIFRATQTASDSSRRPEAAPTTRPHTCDHGKRRTCARVCVK